MRTNVSAADRLRGRLEAETNVLVPPLRLGDLLAHADLGVLEQMLLLVRLLNLRVGCATYGQTFGMRKTQVASCARTCSAMVIDVGLVEGADGRFFEKGQRRRGGERVRAFRLGRRRRADGTEFERPTSQRA